MNYQEVVDLMNLRFTSGNSCPIDRASIKVEEWEIIKNAIESAVSEERNRCRKLALAHSILYEDAATHQKEKGNDDNYIMAISMRDAASCLVTAIEGK